METITAYTSHKDLAKDVCFAMASVYGVTSVTVTSVKGFGYFVECGTRNVEMVMTQLKGQLGKRFHNVSWQ